MKPPDRRAYYVPFPLDFGLVSPELVLSFRESSCRNRSASRSGRAPSCSTRYSARSSSAIAARTIARSSLRLGVGRRTCRVLRYSSRQGCNAG